MTQGCVPEIQELKLQQRPDKWGSVEPQPYFSSRTPFPVALTHKTLVDEILGKVNQHQGGDISQEALEEWEK